VVAVDGHGDAVGGVDHVAPALQATVGRTASPQARGQPPSPKEDLMKRTASCGRHRLRVDKPLRRKNPLQQTSSLAATDRQRAVVAGRPCIACNGIRGIDPAHLIPRSLGGCGEALCVVPLCRTCHRACDRGELDLLPYLEPGWRAQLAHAVGHVGLIGALRRISGRRQPPAGIGES
jgi:hypothetical protein